MDTIPTTVSLTALYKALKSKHGMHMIDMFGDVSAIVPGNGCQCFDCFKEREALLREILPKVREEHERMLRALCPQRAAHDLKDDLLPMDNQPFLGENE
jgi:hypothetical protein